MHSVPYDHARKAGNPGDLFKHAILAHVAARLTRPGGSFRYVESHAGRPLYRLRDGGEWRDGAGELSAPATIGPLTSYWRHALGGRTPTAGSCYPGSAVLLQRVVSSGGGTVEMRLWERAPAVVEAMRVHFSGDERVEVLTGDGYRGVAGVEEADLVLVDPITLEGEPVATLLQRLHFRNIPFLCWVPRRGDEEGREREDSQAFQRAMGGVLAVESARWREWREGTCGCYMVVSPALRETTEEAAREVRSAVGWGD